MTSEEFAEARQRLGLTIPALAAKLQLTPHVVEGFETGALAVDRKAAGDMVFLMGVQELEEIRAASGLPACEWMAQWERESSAPGGRAAQARFEALLAHFGSCPTCKALDAEVRSHLGPMPQVPQRGLVRAFGLFERVPSWARPALAGAMLLGGITSLRLLFALPRIRTAPELVGMALVAVLVSAGAGATGGFAYSLTRPTLKRLGRPGDYLTGVVCVFAYMGALLIVAPLAFGESIVKEPSELAVFAVVSTFFGLVIGHSWFRNTTGG